MVDYFRVALAGAGRVFAGDFTPLSPALYRADGAVRLPEMIDAGYASAMLAECLQRDIRLVVPLSDLELPVLSEHVEKFAEQGIALMVSDPSTIALCFDKWQTYLHLCDLDIPTPQTYDELDRALANEMLPLVLKPRRGSASRGLHVVEDEDAARSLWREGYIAQRFIRGEEYGLDILTDQNGRLLSVVPRRKLAMRAGETDKAVCVRDETMIDLGVKIAESLRPLGVRGAIDVDLMRAKEEDEVLVLEINPRFGGGYPVAHLAGADFPRLLIALAKGDEVPENIRAFQEDQVVMLKELSIMPLRLDQVEDIFKADSALSMQNKSGSTRGS
jgi:carbamoyl-phosphate synthase large subunit